MGFLHLEHCPLNSESTPIWFISELNEFRMLSSSFFLLFAAGCLHHIKFRKKKKKKKGVKSFFFFGRVIKRNCAYSSRGGKGLVLWGGGVHSLEGVHHIVQLIGVIHGDFDWGGIVRRGVVVGRCVRVRGLCGAGSGELGEQVIDRGSSTYSTINEETKIESETIQQKNFRFSRVK